MRVPRLRGAQFVPQRGGAGPVPGRGGRTGFIHRCIRGGGSSPFDPVWHKNCFPAIRNGTRAPRGGFGGVGRGISGASPACETARAVILALRGTCPAGSKRAV